MSVIDPWRQWQEIRGLGYASPIVASYLQSPARSLAWGAFSVLDPYRSSLPALYRNVPSQVADVIALQSDWGMFGMDYAYVEHSLPSVDERQETLFDRDRFKR